MPIPLDLLPSAPALVQLLAGYAQWADALRAIKPDWQAEDLTFVSLRQAQPDFGGLALEDLLLYQTHFAGRDWQGNQAEWPSYLCLCESEARMVAHEIQQPSRKARRLYFSEGMRVSHEPISLFTLLDTPEGRKRLHERLKSLLIYSIDDYLQADSLFFWFRGGAIGHWLYRDDRMLPPLDPEKHLPIEMRWGKPTVVWSRDGLGGLIDFEGDFVLRCRYAYLSTPSAGLAEVRVEPLPPITPPVNHFDFLRYTCDILDIWAGAKVNPPGVAALQGSLDVAGECFVACEAGMYLALPRMGFMNANGSWLGRSDWADVLLFNEDLAAVQCPDTGLWGFIDALGNLAVQPRYAGGSFFNGGMAIVPLPMEQAAEGTRWVLIDQQGTQLSGPWHEIDHGRSRTFLVRDGAARWGLLNQRGVTLLAPIALEPESSEGERLETLWKRYREQRLQGLAERLATLPLAQAVVGLELQSERDFHETGLLRKKVNVLRVPANWQETFGSTAQGRIGWNYPNSASLFNFEKECPVMLDRTADEPLSLGIPWGDLELCQ